MKRKTFSFLGLLALIFVTNGCATTGRGYLADRWRDLAGVFSADVGTSTGFQAQVGVSHIAQIGFGSYRGTRAGFRDGQMGSWVEERSELGIGPLYIHEVDWENPSEHMVGHHHAMFHEPGYVEFPWEWGSTVSDRSPGDVGVSANLVLIGVSLQFRTTKFADFLTGWFGLDILGDDLGDKDEASLIRDLNSKESRVRTIAARHLALITGKTNGYRSYSSPDSLSDEQRRAIEAWEKK